MAFWSAVDIATVVEAGRIDGDYFKPSDLATIRRIAHDKAGVELGSIAQVLTGRTPSHYAPGGALSVVRSGDLVAPLIYPTCGRPFLKAGRSRDRVALHQGDILISSIGLGSIGKISLVVDPTNLITVSEVTVIRVSDEISSNFLFAYLASPTGQSQIKREITGATGQQHLLKSKVARILVPALPDVIEPKLRRAVQEAHQRQESRRIAYEEAEALLESELALDTLDLKRRLFFDRSYRSILDAERFDAEFFQPRVQNLMMTLARGEKRLGDVATLSKRRFKPKAGKKFNYIEIGDLSDTGIAESTSILGENAPSRAAWVVEPGDIITTTVRPIRRLTAMIIKGQSGYVCSSGFAVLRPSSEIAPEVLLVYLRLPLVAELLDLHTTASMYPAIATADLVRIPISLPDKSTQNKIVAAIKRSINSQREARQYLDEAKQIVERAVLGE